MPRGLPTIFCALLLASAIPASAQPVLQQQVEARLRAVGPGPRFGLVVTTEDGRELIAINAGRALHSRLQHQALHHGGGLGHPDRP